MRGSAEGGGSRLDLSGNVLTSPPLAHRAGSQALGDYLAMLSAEPQAVSRIRLMVVGFGGVGKTTFCGAATCELPSLLGESRRISGLSSRGHTG